MRLLAIYTSLRDQYLPSSVCKSIDWFSHGENLCTMKHMGCPNQFNKSTAFTLLASEVTCPNTRLFIAPNTHMHMQYPCRTLSCIHMPWLPSSLSVVPGLQRDEGVSLKVLLLSRSVTSNQDLPNPHYFTQANCQIYISFFLLAFLLLTVKLWQQPQQHSTHFIPLPAKPS